MMHEFVDTNVLLYAYDVSAGERHVRARELVGRLGRERMGVLSVQVLQEFYVNATRKIAEPLSPASARERVLALARWRLHTPSAADVIAASEIAEQTRRSFWDAMIVRSATQMNCSVLWTEDLDHGQRVSGVELRNPFEG
ncbi:PIN domain-containing protein [Agromyces sp. H66]|uniref:PIN domain-containing protein n=1 Tax=Agromyces sp. H66 TaxID=2529859 RepID=UPI0010A9B557|nr:PIN domain-containing protein [Agromyces sp. H66]